MDLKNKQGVMIHPCLRKYRVELLNELNKNVSIDLIENSYPSSGGFVYKERAEALESLELNVIKQKRKGFFGFRNSDLSIFKSFSRKYDFVIFSSFISLPFLMLFIPLKLLGKKIIIFDEIWKYPETNKYKYARPFFKLIVWLSVDGFILAGSKAYEFNREFFKRKKTLRTVAFNCHENTSGIEIDNKRKSGVLYLGRVVEIKGLDILIDAMQHVDAELTVVGDGSFMAICQQKVKELKLESKVHFLGACERSYVESYFKEHKVFCLPSRFMANQSQQLESWGFTVNEALSMGCIAVASSNVGSAHDLITEGINGYIFESDKSEDLANKINLALSLKTEPSSINQSLNNNFNNIDNAKKIQKMLISLLK